MGKLNAYQKRQILISFSIQTLSHTFINNLNCRSLANKNAFSILTSSTTSRPEANGRLKISSLCLFATQVVFMLLHTKKLTLQNDQIARQIDNLVP
jgi:hypothetical protein